MGTVTGESIANRRISGFGAAMLSLGMGFAPVAMAAEGAKEDTLDEVVVTATRRAERAIDVPMSITAISGDQLVSENKDDLADYVRTIPGVSFRAQSAGLNQVTIRGVTGGFARAKAPVSFYIDDMPVVSDPSATPDLKTFDVERVEVLRGPQGTLFGESAIGGVIRVISRRPDPKSFDAALQASYISFAHGDGGFTADGMINLPVVEDKFALRLSVSRRDEGGYIDNISPIGEEDQNTLDYTSGRISALWNASESLTVSATALLSRSEYGAYPQASTRYLQNRKVDETRKDDIDQFNVTLEYEFDWAKLVSSSNYYKRKTSRLFDLTDGFNGFLPGLAVTFGAQPMGFTSFTQFWQTLDIDDKSLAQELRLVSPGEGPFRWVAGLYYFDTDNDVGVDFLGVPTSTFTYLRLRRAETYTQQAVFGEVEYDLSPRWTLVAGARHTKEDRDTNYDQRDSWPGPVRVFLPATGTKTISSDYSITTPKLALRFKPNENTQIYALYSRGFRGPGGNIQFSNSPGENNDSYSAETLDSFEIGTKGRLVDGRLSYEFAVFRSDWTDRQEVANPAALPPQQFVANAGEARLRGLEVAASWSFNRYLTVGAQGSYLDTEITQSTNPALIGAELTFQPRVKGSAFGDVNFPMGSLRGRARAEVIYTGSEFWNAANTVQPGGFPLWNASVGVDSEKWGVTLFGKNLSDRVVQYFNGIVGEPRQYGISFSYDFGPR